MGKTQDKATTLTRWLNLSACLSIFTCTYVCTNPTDSDF